MGIILVTVWAIGAINLLTKAFVARMAQEALGSR